MDSIDSHAVTCHLCLKKGLSTKEVKMALKLPFYIVLNFLLDQSEN